MYYVYLIESVQTPNCHYVGFSQDLRQRLTDHNAGKLPTTSVHRPWRLVTYVAFSSKQQALSFEKYLKSGSGHAFANKRLWLKKQAPLSSSPASALAGTAILRKAANTRSK